MRNILLVFALLAGFASGALAENITVEDVTIGRGGKAKLNIGVKVESDSASYHAFQMDIALPEGFTMQNNSLGSPEVVYTDRLSTVFSDAFSNYQTDKDVYSIAAIHKDKPGIPVGDGTILYMTIIANDSVPDGTYTGTISRIIFSSMEDQSIYFDNASFTITVSGEYTGITLDETSTEALTATTEAADITVKRTINADEWSTLVLPFSMTGDELTSAFGENAQMAEFSEWAPSEDEDTKGNPLAISMIFKTKALSEGLEANHPVLIRLEHAIDQFSVKDKTLEPETKPTVEVNMTGSTSSRKKASFIGSYNPLSIEEEMLFLSDNKFYYSKGKTTMNGFRGYFSVPDVVSDYYNSSSSAKVNIAITDSATGISSVRGATNTANSLKVYSISGQYVGNDINRLPTGVYIVNGRKVLVK